MLTTTLVSNGIMIQHYEKYWGGGEGGGGGGGGGGGFPGGLPTNFTEGVSSLGKINTFPVISC